MTQMDSLIALNAFCLAAIESHPNPAALAAALRRQLPHGQATFAASLAGPMPSGALTLIDAFAAAAEAMARNKPA